MLFEVDIHPNHDGGDPESARITSQVKELGLAPAPRIRAARGYLIEVDQSQTDDIGRIARALLIDPVIEEAIIAEAGEAALYERLPHADGDAAGGEFVHVLPKPGVMDPVAQSALAAIKTLGVTPKAVRTLRKYWIHGVAAERIPDVCYRVLANDAIEQVVRGPLDLERLDLAAAYEFARQTIKIDHLDDAGLMRLSREGQLYLQLAEMQTIQRHFAELGQDPTDVELETIAQTWSEHCSHKTLAGRIAYRDERGERKYENMLRETIFAATDSIRAALGDDDWCVSVFKDNAGIVHFDDAYHLAFKVETHNHPSALEPYGGANTGIGGVIRDVMGTGLGAKPIASTDVFCFAPPDTPLENLPDGVLHPRRVMKGVVEGVRDYGNRMGIPTVNGAIYFDERYLGNPLVFCGSVGLIPHDKAFKQPQPGDFIVAVGGRTGRDGIHGATFSSAELTSQSESLSGGAVQIGNAIEEKKVLDVLLAARDRNLYTAITDCGAGGFSSAVGEMGEDIGAEVWLDRAPLKYEGLSYTEIWISEAQERMVLSVPEQNIEALSQLCGSEDVEATVLGRFVPTGRLVLKYNDHTVGDLSMAFLHDGRPPVVREAVYEPAAVEPLELPAPSSYDPADTLSKILSSLNVASKHWVIRQYDHEVQGASVIKPLVGVAEDGPSDAAVIAPRLGESRGVAIACGMNPRYGDLDPYWMAASAIDEAVRNCVAVGSDPTRIAILDNFCWGDCERAATLGALVRAAIACGEMAVELGTPFISGKDSLNNEFSYIDPSSRQKQTIAIPATLLISAIGQVDDIAKCVTMDLKQAGNLLYLVGSTQNELGGSHFALVEQLTGGQVPLVNAAAARQSFAAVHAAIAAGTVRACHDLSEGGLAVAMAEMCFAGGLGARIDLSSIPTSESSLHPMAALFSESNTRFLCEVEPAHASEFERCFADIPYARLGDVVAEPALRIVDRNGNRYLNADVSQLKRAWQQPLDW